MRPPIGSDFHELTTIHSTNMYAMEQIHAGLANHGTVYFAHQQVAGKGQRGRTWWSQPGQNIALTAILDTAKLSISQRFRLSATLSVGVLDYLQHTLPGNWKTKWPNDLYFNDRKAGGILLENVVQGGRWRLAVAGIGLNMNQHTFPDHLPNPISLRLIGGSLYDCGKEARHLCGFLEKRWQQLLDNGWQFILKDYNEHLFGRGEICRIKKESAVIPCIIREVDDLGFLIAGERGEWRFEFSEVSWVL